MNILLPIKISLIAGIVFLFLPKKLNLLIRITSPIIGIVSFILSIIIFFNYKVPPYVLEFVLHDMLSRFIYLGIGFFGFIISIYSSQYRMENINKFFAYFFLTLASAFAISITNNFIILLTLWGFLGLTLYLMIQLGREGANEAAKKSLMIIGASDCFLLIGIGILWHLTNSLNLSYPPLAIDSPLIAFSFLCFIIAAFAKIGAIPLHTWVPPCAYTAPIPVTAYLPASLDKLLGIYLLARCVLSIYQFSYGFSTLLMIVGAITIIVAVFMAMVQLSGRKLLSYLAISQVGYMVLGIGTFSPIGIVGGMFHMLNDAISKCCLFLGLGDIEQTKSTDNLYTLGGPVRKMSLTFSSMLIAALAISGIPPLNGFFSKWLVYQGTIEVFGRGSPFIPAICLIAALFGSALTLATFLKLLHSIFLARGEEVSAKRTPMFIIAEVILAALCIILGLFAYSLFLKPVFQKIMPFEMRGVWQPQLSTILIIIGIILGMVIYFLSKVKVRVTKEFIGGEEITPEMKISGADFYLTIEQIPIFGNIYKLAERKIFDLYDRLRSLIFLFTKIFRFVHPGALSLYLLWLIIGLIIILLVWGG